MRINVNNLFPGAAPGSGRKCKGSKDDKGWDSHSEETKDGTATQKTSTMVFLFPGAKPGSDRTEKERMEKGWDSHSEDTHSEHCSAQLRTAPDLSGLQQELIAKRPGLGLNGVVFGIGRGSTCTG
jgi:hypothetical protein